jgi:hypothetical protein
MRPRYEQDLTPGPAFCHSRGRQTTGGGRVATVPDMRMVVASSLGCAGAEANVSSPDAHGQLAVGQRPLRVITSGSRDRMGTCPIRRRAYESSPQVKPDGTVGQPISQPLKFGAHPWLFSQVGNSLGSRNIFAAFLSDPEEAQNGRF